MAVNIQAIIEERERRIRKLQEGIRKCEKDIAYYQYLIREERRVIKMMRGRQDHG